MRFPRTIHLGPARLGRSGMVVRSVVLVAWAIGGLSAASAPAVLAEPGRQGTTPPARAYLQAEDAAESSALAHRLDTISGRVTELEQRLALRAVVPAVAPPYSSRVSPAWRYDFSPYDGH